MDAELLVFKSLGIDNMTNVRAEFVTSNFSNAIPACSNHEMKSSHYYITTAVESLQQITSILLSVQSLSHPVVPDPCLFQPGYPNIVGFPYLPYRLLNLSDQNRKMT
nr:hypothetical protein HmN_000541400 [Hymenolepis microstoma]